jgi:hypothetical protein
LGAALSAPLLPQQPKTSQLESTIYKMLIP